MNNYCADCGKNLEGFGFKCRYCGEYFCVEHQLPENHGCQGLDEWKAGKLKEFKKEVKISEKHGKSGFLKNRKWLEFLLIILGVGLLIVLLRILT